MHHPAVDYRPSRPFTLLAAFSLHVLLLAGCGGGSGGGGDTDDEPRDPPDEVIAADVLTPWVNGFQLVRSTTALADNAVFVDDQYRIGSDGRSIERSSQLDSGSGPAAIEVIHRFNDQGFIVSRENVASDGALQQQFDTAYDSAGRKISEMSFNGTRPFLTTVYEREGDGRLLTQRVTNSGSGNLFSERTYTYTPDGALSEIRLTTPLLSREFVDEYTFEDATGRLVERREINTVTGGVMLIERFDFDDNGNLMRIEERGASGAISLIKAFEYEPATDPVPNLLLHEITHDLDQL